MKCRRLLLFLPLVLLAVSCARDPKVQAQRFLDDGNRLREKGDLNHATEAFRRASQLSPNDMKALVPYSLLLHATGKEEQAKLIYERILRIQPDHWVAMNLASIKADEDRRRVRRFR